jgi:hypothetical protein
MKIGTIQNSPSDRLLSRALKFAALVRLLAQPTLPTDALCDRQPIAAALLFLLGSCPGLTAA